MFDVDRQTGGRTDRHNDVNCPFSQFLRKRLKYLMDFINWLKESLKIFTYHKKGLTAYCFGKHDVKFVRSGYTKSPHFENLVFLSVSTKRITTNDIRLIRDLTFVMLDTSRIVTSFNALWSHNVAKTVIMLPTV